ncbi:aminoacetone oxidase family FAD-binding enzyme [Helicobacter sp. WB40]|nr:aminoacetone oxidase family FAD-binding enzyme [Helicobacter sp. WB40]MDA3967252.1 aminoacetone oxidase family FAD-binding enzyme [Helicobacter sp. WB40]
MGGGASGIFVAVLLKGCGLDITIFEKNKTIGKKLLASGNGKCNIHNTNGSSSDYASSSLDKNQIQKIINKFTYSDFYKLCSKLGLPLIAEGSKVYPMSYSAKSVLEVFQLSLEEVHIRCNEEIIDIKLDKNYKIKSNKQEYEYDFVVVSCGSNAHERLGGSDSGYRLGQKLGFQLVDTYPVLTPLKCKQVFCDLNGLKVFSKITLKDKNIKIIEIDGDLLFTNYGVSGFGILDISYYLNLCEIPSFSVDLLPNISKEALEKILINSIKTYKNASLCEILSGIVNPKLAKYLTNNKKSDIKSIKNIVYAIKNLQITPELTQEANNAEVCGGGISFECINIDTFESKKYKNLYIIGEVLDIVGKRGGHNLAFAWSGAYICANSIKKRMQIQ